MRFSAIMILLAIFASPIFAYQLAVKVTVSQGTLAVGTNVSLMTNGVEIYSQKAGPDGIATFQVEQGSYFVILRRYPYPTLVQLQRVDSDTQAQFTMRQVISYSNLYGQVSGPSSFAESYVTAYDQHGIIAKKTYLDKNGFYLLSFLPEGNYNVTVDSPGFQQASQQMFLPNSEFVMFNTKLSPIGVQPELPPALSSPSQVQQYSAIEVRLAKGSQGMANQTILAKTPAGTVEIVTGQDGIARINAAQAGRYEFSFGSASSSTYVAAKVPENQSAPPAQPPAQPTSQQQGGNQSVLFAAAALVVVVLLGLSAVAIALKLAFSAKKRRGHSRESHERHGAHHEHAHHKKQ